MLPFPRKKGAAVATVFGLFCLLLRRSSVDVDIGGDVRLEMETGGQIEAVNAHSHTLEHATVNNVFDKAEGKGGESHSYVDTAPMEVHAGSGDSFATLSPTIWTYSPLNYNGCFWHWVLTPIIATLGEAFGAVGMRVRYGGYSNACEVVQNVAAALRSGLLPIVIVVGWHLVDEDCKGCCLTKDDCELKQSLKQMIQMGAYVIAYSTESNDVPAYVQMVESMMIKEIWTYSVFLQRRMADLLTSGMIVRYVPPGCALELDFNVSLDAPARNDSTAGFIGARDERRNRHRHRVIASFGDRIVPAQLVKNPLAVRRYIERRPIQLNLHGKTNKHVLEMFRISMLLTNKACVFAERLGVDDDRAVDSLIFKDIVSFVPRVPLENMRNAVTALMDKGSGAVRACQERSRAWFCERFLPEKILSDSGFLDQWQKLSVRTI